MITQYRLKEMLEYDPETGLFVWKVSTRGARKGRVAGGITNKYLAIRIDGKLYYSHRLAWLYVYGVWPTNDIDHKDHDKKNNVIANLRDATRSENLQNMVDAKISNISTGLLGSCFSKSHGKYIASISVGRKRKHIGVFQTAELAHKAYVEAKRVLHPFGTI